jgi:hypothetical protein
MTAYETHGRRVGTLGRMERQDARGRTDLSLWARWTASSAIGWALVAALVPVCQVAVRVLGSAAWPVVVLGGALAGGLLLGAAQALVVGGDPPARTRWVLGTAAGVALATASVPLTRLGGAAGVGAAAGVALAAVQLGIAAPRPLQWRGPGWWLVASMAGAAVLFAVWGELWGSLDGWPWAVAATRAIRPWLGETPHEIAVAVLVGLASGCAGGAGYGAVTGLALGCVRARRRGQSGGAVLTP